MKANVYNRKYVNRLDALLAVFLFAMLFLAACSPPGSTLPGTGGETPEASGGYQSVIDQLEAAGATIEPLGQLQEPFFGNPALAFNVNGENVQIFEFSTEAEREAAAATISGNGFIIGTSMVDWISIPHFFAAERVIVLYVGTNPAMIELLTGILGEPITGTQP